MSSVNGRSRCAKAWPVCSKLFLLAIARDFSLIAPWLTPFWAANEAAMNAAGGNVGGSMIMHYPARADLLNWLFLLLVALVQFYSGRDFSVHAWKALKARTANGDVGKEKPRPVKNHRGRGAALGKQHGCARSQCQVLASLNR